jgi:AraC-like DNA-binding protein
MAAPPLRLHSGRGTAALRRRLAPSLLLHSASGGAGEPEPEFRHRSLHLGELPLHRLELAPCRLELSGAEGQACLVLPLSGEATLRSGRRGSRPLAADAGRTAVLLPGGPFQLHCASPYNAMLIGLPRPMLLAAASALLAPQDLLVQSPHPKWTRLEGRLERCWQWREDAGVNRDLLGLLRQTLAVLERSTDGRAGTLPLAGTALQAWLLQPLALLLLQELPPRAEFTAANLGARSLERVLGHIDANLHRPLELRDLCDQCGCSPRALQYAFQRRFGCGPMQWLRERRLEAVAQALRQADGREPLGAIARRWGYTNLSSFSRDIQRHFGQPPSALRRSEPSGVAQQEPGRPGLAQ